MIPTQVRRGCLIALSAGLLLVPLARGAALPKAPPPGESPVAVNPAFPVYPNPLPPNTELPSPGRTRQGGEFLIARTSQGTPFLVMVTVEDDPAPPSPSGYTRGKGRQTLVDTEDFPALLATGLHDEAALRATRTVTGKPVDQITLDGRPGHLSGAGFLADDEDLLSVLRGDNQLVRRMALRHSDLARPLFHVWNLILAEFELGRVNRFTNDLASFRYHQHEVRIRAHPTKGFQESIFNDEIRGSFDIELWRDLEAAEGAFLRARYAHVERDEREALIRRLTRVRIGEMVPYYIGRYGFYEGHTPYRADPLAVAWIFGLRTLSQLEEAFPGRLNRALQDHHHALETAKSLGPPSHAKGTGH